MTIPTLTPSDLSQVGGGYSQPGGCIPMPKFENPSSSEPGTEKSA